MMANRLRKGPISRPGSTYRRRPPPVRDGLGREIHPSILLRRAILDSLTEGRTDLPGPMTAMSETIASLYLMNVALSDRVMELSHRAHYAEARTAELESRVAAHEARLAVQGQAVARVAFGPPPDLY